MPETFSQIGAHFLNPPLHSDTLDIIQPHYCPLSAVTEVPRLEEWFLGNTHPSQALIARYTDDLNSQPYRNKFPRLEQKNIQFWFKNRRVKSVR